MAKTRVIKASIALDDSRFQNSVKNINSSLRLVNQQFKEGQSAVKAYGATKESLTKIQEAYKTKIDLLTKQQANYIKGIENEQKELNNNIKKRDELISKIDEQEAKMKELEQTHSKSSEEYKKEEKALELLLRQLKSSENTINKNTNTINRYNTGLSKAQTEINKTEGELKKLGNEFDNVGVASNNLNNTIKSFNINNVVDGIQGVANGLSNTFDKINSKIIGFGKEMINTGVSFNQSMANFQAVSGATGEQLQQVEDKAKQLGETTKYSASQASDAFGYMALAGFEVEDSLVSVEKVLKLATVANMDLATASDMYTDSLSALGLEIKDTDHYLDVLAQTQSKSNTTVHMMMEAYIAAGGQFNKFNVSLEESATMIGLLANQGLKGSEAGNSLNSVLINLNGSTEKVAKAYKEMGIVAYDTQGKFVGYENVLRQLSTKMSKMTEEQKTMWETVLGGKTQAQSLFILLEGMGTGAYDKLKESISASNGALEEQNNILSNTDASKIAGLKSQFEALQLKIFDVFGPTLHKAFDSISKFLDKLNSLDEGTLNTIINLSKWSLVMGLVTKGVSGLAGGIGNIVGLIANFKALSLGASTSTLALANATTTATTSLATVGSSAVSTGGMMAGLGGILTKIGAFISGPWGIALAAGAVAVGGLTYAVKKGSEDCVKSVDLWEQGTVSKTEKIADSYGNLQEVITETTVDISSKTKSNLESILNMHDNHNSKLMEFSLRRREISEAEMNELTHIQQQLSLNLTEESRKEYEERLVILQDKFNKEKEITQNEYELLKEQMDIMTAETNQKLDEKYNGEKAKLLNYLIEVQGMKQADAEQQLLFMDENHKIQTEKMEEYQQQYYDLLAKSYNDKNGLTTEEYNKLMALEDTLRNYQITALSETELEAQVIQNRMKDHSLFVSTEQVGALIRDAENLRVRKIEEANKEYNEYERILTQQKALSSTLTTEQYNEMLSKAQETRDKRILTANEEKIGVLEEIKTMNKEAYNSVDKNSGEMLSRWKKFWQNFTNNTGENAKKNIDSFNNLKNSIDKIPNTQTKTVNIVTNYKQNGTPAKVPTGVKNTITYKMLNEEIRNITLDNNLNYSQLERTINNLTNKVDKTINSIPNTFNNLIKNMDIVNQNNIFLNSKQITKEVNRGIEEERQALSISKGLNRIIIK